jgi:hypothetical protein
MMATFNDGDKVWVKHVLDKKKTRGIIVTASTERSLVEHKADPLSGCLWERNWYPNKQLIRR